RHCYSPETGPDPPWRASRQSRQEARHRTSQPGRDHSSRPSHNQSSATPLSFLWLHRKGRPPQFCQVTVHYLISLPWQASNSFHQKRHLRNRATAGPAAGAILRLARTGFAVASTARAARLCRFNVEDKRIVLNLHQHMPALQQTPKKHLIRERLLDALLNDAGKRPRTHLLIIAALGEPLVCVRRKLDGDVPVGKLCFKLEHELLDNLRDNPLRQMTEGDHRIKPVAELRREEPLDGILIIPDALLLREADCRLCHIGSARICRHDKYDIAEVDLLAVMVGQLAVI